MINKTQQSNISKIPKLRFAGFSVEWGKKKLGEVALFWNGKAHEQDISEHGKYVVVNSKFISQNGKVKKYSDTQISQLRKDDITIVMSDIPDGKAIGKCFLVDKDDGYTLNQRIGGIKSKEILSSFLFRVLNRNKYFLKFDNGVSQTNLRKDEVLGCPVIFPSVPEQKKIAEFLESTDRWVENLKVQKESLESYKKGMMQKLFSQEMRFKDDKGKDFPKWIQKKLGTVFYAEKGNGLPKEEVVKDGENECILYGELYTTYSEVISSVCSRTNSKDGLLSQIGDLLIPCSTTTTGIDLANVTALNKKNVKLGGDITVLRSEDKIDNIFYAYYLSNYKKKEIAKYAQGSTIVHLYYSHFKNMNIDVPHYEEQIKISNFLTSVDKVIESKQQQITQAELWKKGLMQGLFV